MSLKDSSHFGNDTNRLFEKFTPFPLDVFTSSSSQKLCLLSTKIQSGHGPCLEELATQWNSGNEQVKIQSTDNQHFALVGSAFVRGSVSPVCIYLTWTFMKEFPPWPISLWRFHGNRRQQMATTWQTESKKTIQQYKNMEVKWGEGTSPCVAHMRTEQST